MSALDTLFRNLRAAKRKALMPFVTAGDPDLQFTADLLRCLIARGSSLCELGIPYSDPIADGPVIQSSYTRALQHKVKLAEIFAMLGRVAPELKAPLVSMVSYSIIYRQGLRPRGCRAQGGVPGDRARLARRGIGRAGRGLRRHDFSLIQLIAPRRPASGHADCRADQRLHLLCLDNRHYGRAERIAAGGSGQRRLAPRSDAAADLHRVRHQPAGARADARPVADGLIVGSAIVRRVAEARPGRGRPCCKRSATTSPSCSPRWSSVLLVAGRGRPECLGLLQGGVQGEGLTECLPGKVVTPLFGHEHPDIGMGRGGADHLGEGREALVESPLPGKDHPKLQSALGWLGSIARALRSDRSASAWFPRS